jgi:hypothetical protein
MKTILKNTAISVAISFIAATIIVGIVGRMQYTSHELVAEKFKTEIDVVDNRVKLSVITDQITDCDELLDAMNLQPIEISGNVYLPVCTRTDEVTFVIEYIYGQEV